MKKNAEKRDPGNGNGKKTPGEAFRDAAILSAPTILIVYPLVGFGLGYILVKALNWPLWVSLITLIMGFIQGLRDVYRLGSQMNRNQDR